MPHMFDQTCFSSLSTKHVALQFMGLIVGVCSEDLQVGDEVDDSGEFFDASAVAV